MHRFTRDGVGAQIRRRRGAEFPSLAWSIGKLAVAYQHDSETRTELLDAPR